MAHTVINSLFNSCSYIIKNGCAIIDCGDLLPIMRYVDNCGQEIASILLTHAHFDHIYGLNDLLAIYRNALVYTNQAGREMLLNAEKNMSYYHETPFVFNHLESIRVVCDREIIKCSNGLSAQAFFTPGHNPSCITWVIDDMIFSGDALIPGIKTVTNLPGGNKALALKSEELIKKLALNKTILPGHVIS